MTVRAKFQCVEVAKSTPWDQSKGPFQYRAKFTPVIDGSEENKRFYSLTPGGSVELATYVEDHFVPGKFYYLDFTEAE